MSSLNEQTFSEIENDIKDDMHSFCMNCINEISAPYAARLIWCGKCHLQHLSHFSLGYLVVIEVLGIIESLL